VAVPQLSVAVVEKVTLLEQLPPAPFTVMLAGQVMTGFWLSTTVTEKLQLAVLPWPSFTVQFTVVDPRPNDEPLVGVQVTVAVPQLSVAVVEKVTLLEQLPPAAFTVIFAGQVMTGFWLSTTVTEKLQLAVLPWPSLAVQFTVVEPRP